MAIFVVIFAISSVYPSAIIASHIQAVETTNSNEEVVSSVYNGFYEDIGTIYNAETDDGITIKTFRYHPSGEDFNHNGKAILLFPGLCTNINQFLMKSTPEMEGQFGDINLPETLAPWAQGDQNIQDDPLLYYSYAYYLWSQGYDPWFANYRGIGYGPMASESAGSKVSLDDFGLYDVKAAVQKVYYVTGKHPYIGGHSTGGLTPLMYIQGTYYSWTGYVRSDWALVEERNGIDEGSQTVSGFIGLDPAWIPGMTKALDNIFLWILASSDLNIDLRSIIEWLIEEIPVSGDIMAWLFDIITDEFGEDVAEVFSYILNIDTTNMNEELMYFFIRYAVDRLYFRTLAHYLDFIAHDTVRECFKNGWFNEWKVEPPEPGGWFDYYYYYIDNTYRMSMPAIIFLAEEENDVMDLVDGDTVVRDVYNGKTQNTNDELYWLEGAHIDMPIGLRAPTELFPKLGSWLIKV